MTDNCLNCETQLAGRWCHVCGQKRIEPRDRTLGSLLGEFFRELTDLDGRVWRSFVSLVFRPGTYLCAYLHGKRRRFLSPVSLFLLSNVAFFFAPTLTDFTPSLQGHTTVQAHAAIAEKLVQERLTARGLELVEYETKFELRQNDFARTLLFLHVPLLALGLALLHRKRRLLFADHALIAFAIMAFVLLHSLLMPRILEFVADPQTLSMTTRNWVLRVGLLGPLVVWLYFMLKGAFSQTAWRAIVKVPLVFAVLAVAHLAYRAILFLVVFAAT